MSLSNDRTMDDQNKEGSMKRGEEQEPVGSSPEEAQRVNAIKGPFKKPGILSKALDVATGLTLLGVGGLGLKSAAEQAPQRPPQTTPDQRGPNPPPEGVRLAPQPDSSAPSVFRLHLPSVSKNYQETPLRLLREFGNLETDKVLFINKGEKAWVEMGNEELYRNLLWRRDNYAMYPNIKRTIVFFGSLEQLQEKSWIPYNFPYNTTFHPGNNYIGPSERRWARKPDGSLEFHISSPSPKQGVDLELAKQLISGSITTEVNASLWSNEEGLQQLLDRFGNGAGTAGSQKAKDFQEHPIVTRNEAGLQIAAFSVVFQ